MASGLAPIRDQGLPRSSRQAQRATISSVRLTALIVDDHDGFRAMARQMLEDAGFEVRASDYGEHRVAGSSARGFVPKAELSGTILAPLLAGTA